MGVVLGNKLKFDCTWSLNFELEVDEEEGG